LKKSGRPKEPEQTRKVAPGFYRHFPEISHKLVYFIALASDRKLQDALVKTLRKTNDKTFSLDALTDPSIENCNVIFECGVAEGDDFTFLNDQESERIQKAIRTEALQVLDIVCAVRYYKSSAKKKVPLKFDYYMVRFRFDEYRIIQVFHERGPGYLSPKDIINFLVSELNSESQKTILRINASQTS
jgi:hypothetical protein